MTLPEQLQSGRRIAGMPVWAIGVILAALLLGFLWFRNRRKTPVQGTVTPDLGTYYGGEEGVSGLPPGAIGDYLGGNPLDPAYPVGLTPMGIPGPITNVQWSRLAFDYLVGLGSDPALVGRALAKYIQGQALDEQEQAVANNALRAFGAPPEGLIVTPPSSPGTPPSSPSGPIVEHVTAGQKSDAWINYVSSKYGTYFGDLVAMNPSLPANISLSPTAANRYFIKDADYKVKA